MELINNMNKNFDLYEIQYDVQLAANIINARVNIGMTQQDLAQKLKTSQPAIARAENGDQPPSHKMLKKIARAFGARLTPPDFILESTAEKAIFSFMLDVAAHASSQVVHEHLPQRNVPVFTSIPSSKLVAMS
jgi:transcriptional regulator with XRE-family HTH domain